MDSCPFRSAYSGRVRVAVDFSASDANGHGAIQSFKAECDINGIMAKYQRTGVVSWLERRGAEYLDVSEYDFRAAIETLEKGRDLFQELPSTIRERFGNDPAFFLRFMHDPANKEEAMRLGLLKQPQPPPAPVRVEVVTPPPAA